MWQAVAVVMGIIILYIVIIYNKLVRGKQHVDQSESGVDIYLKQRFDLIPNLVECTKAYCKYEENTLTEIARLRSAYEKTRDIGTGIDLNLKFNRLMAIVESNADLKANEQFLMLQKTLTKLESQLQAARRLYNSEVTNFNKIVSMFPSNLIASAFGFEQEKLFEVESGIERENIDINFETREEKDKNE